MSITGWWRLPQIAQRVADPGPALMVGAEHLLTVSQGRVPVDTGVLRASGVASTDGRRAAVSYDTPYAARQHEEIGWHHPKGGQAKYLESALHDEENTIRKLIQHQLKGMMGT